MIRPRSRVTHKVKRLPRMRGDDPNAVEFYTVKDEFAPHARG